MSWLGQLVQVWPTARHEHAIAAERGLRAPLPVVRRVGFASLRGGSGCSTTARGIAATLSGPRGGGVVLIDATDIVPARPIPVPSPVAQANGSRAAELTLTDWGAIDSAQFATAAASSHVLCLTTTTERLAVQQALDAAAFAIDAGTPTLLIASAVRGRATNATRRMLASSPIPIFLLPFDRTTRRAEPAARSSASTFALATLGAEIVRRCGRPSAETRAA